MRLRICKEGVYSKSSYEYLLKCLMEKHFPKYNAEIVREDLCGEKFDKRRVIIEVEIESKYKEAFIAEYIEYGYEVTII